MEKFNEMDDLFGTNLDTKMDFLNEKKPQSADGVYRIDLTKVKDKKRGYRSVVRFLPNLTKEGKVGQAAIEKIAHYVNIKEVKELSGWFDSPKNFGEKCPLTDLYYQMMNSKNVVLQEKAKCLNYSKKYYSYVLVLEDEQQPDLVGKIMLFSYGKTIKDKIAAERNGEITGVSCNIFDLAQGKDFVLLAKEISTGDENYPDYKNSMFKPEVTSLPIFNEEKNVFKNVPVVDGKVDARAQQMVKEFLLKREHDLEEQAPKKVSEEQQGKISEIISYLTGKTSGSYNNSSKPSSDDFELDGLVTSGTKEVSNTSTDEDDFFDF
jgi:hypothetical protein